MEKQSVNTNQVDPSTVPARVKAKQSAKIPVHDWSELLAGKHVPASNDAFDTATNIKQELQTDASSISNEANNTQNNVNNSNILDDLCIDRFFMILLSTATNISSPSMNRTMILVHLLQCIQVSVTLNQCRMILTGFVHL